MKKIIFYRIIYFVSRTSEFMYAVRIVIQRETWSAGGAVCPLYVQPVQAVRA